MIKTIKKINTTIKTRGDNVFLKFCINIHVNLNCLEGFYEYDLYKLWHIHKCMQSMNLPQETIIPAYNLFPAETAQFYIIQSQ